MPWINPNKMRCIDDPMGFFDGEVCSRGDFATWLESDEVPMGSTWRIGMYHTVWTVVSDDSDHLRIECDKPFSLSPDDLRNLRIYGPETAPRFCIKLRGIRREVLACIQHYTMTHQTRPRMIDIARAYDVSVSTAGYHIRRMVWDGLCVHRNRKHGDIHLTDAGARIAQRIINTSPAWQEAIRD